VRVTKSNSTGLPAWYGSHYPTWDDLEDFAWELGAVVVLGPVSKGAFFAASLDPGAPAVIVIPQGYGLLERSWSLAHELGHLVNHNGAKGSLFWRKNEAKANHWAACALIPRLRIQHYANASEDAMIAALSVHFEDLPFKDCHVRRLAGRIGKIRLKAISTEVVA